MHNLSTPACCFRVNVITYFFMIRRKADGNIFCCCQLMRLVNEVYHSYNRHQFPAVVLCVNVRSGVCVCSMYLIIIIVVVTRQCVRWELLQACIGLIDLFLFIMKFVTKYCIHMTKKNKMKLQAVTYTNGFIMQSICTGVNSQSGVYKIPAFNIIISKAIYMTGR